MARTFPQFLEYQFLIWQQNAGGRRSVGQFAEWLGFPQSTLSTWWNNGSKPKNDKIIRQLAMKLGIEVYDSLGLERPDEDFYFIEQKWEHLTSADKRLVRNQVEEILRKKNK